MIELTVKTLDSKNHSFSVPDDVTVKQFKEHIADAVNICVDSQRLIYCGRVLQDEKNLSEYDVNGKVVHLVQRAPPRNGSNGPDRGPTGARSTTGTSGSRRTQWRSLFGPGGNSGNAMYLGAMAFPAELMDATGISMQQPRQCLALSRLAVVRSMLQRSSTILNRLENPSQGSSDASPENGSVPTETALEEETVPVSAPVPTVEITTGSIIIGNQQIEIDTPNVEVQAEAVPETAPTASESSEETLSPPSSSGSQEPTQNENEEDGNSGSSRYPRTRALADLLDQAFEINTRVQPFMSQYQQLMRDDPLFSDGATLATNQRLFSSVSEIMHNLAHAYHAMSDIMCDFSVPPPRNLRCRPVLIHHSAVVQTGIPIQVTGNLAANISGQQTSNNDSSATPSSNGNTTSPAPSSTTTEFRVVRAPADSPTPEETTQTQTRAPRLNRVTRLVDADSTTSTATAAAADEAADRQPPSPSMLPPRRRRIGTVGGGSPGFEFIVDVAPGSITIDSVEATVVTNDSPNTSEPNQTWPQNPPEFVQNLITALAGQFIGATFQRFPDQQNTGTNTQQPTAVSSAAASTQQNANSQPSPAQNSQARGNTATHPTTATQTRSTARPHVHLSPALHGLRSNNFDPFLPCNSHHIRNTRVIRERPNQAQANGGTNNPDEAARVVPIPATTSISISLGAEPMINVDQQPSRSSGSQPSAQSLLHPQTLLQAMRDPNSLLPNRGRPSTLAQLLQNIPGYSYTAGESIFTDIFMTLAQCLSFLDMIQLGLGSSECLVQARPHLRQLITQRLLNNEPISIQTISQLVNRFNTECRPYYAILSNARLREEIDVPASINLYNHTMLPTIIHTVMDEDQSTFHRNLMRKCAQYVRQLCAILQYCCLDGASGLESILSTFVNQATTGVPRILQEWTMSHSIENFRTYVGSVDDSIEDIQSYLVYRVGTGAMSSPVPATTPPTTLPAAEPMDTHDIEEVEIESRPSFMREPPIADVPPRQHINEMMGWQNELPSEWVPVITRDVQRQRRQNPQGPFSDAYLSSMPSKRRKLITNAKPQGNLSQVITESMSTALGAAGMSSSPEVDVIAQRAGQDTTLRAAYRDQVRTTGHQNLSSNPDYVPDKYPNTAKYFKKE